MKKNKTIYICQECGNESPKWLGKCPACGSWSSYVEEVIHPDRKQNRPAVSQNRPASIDRIDESAEIRIPAGMQEFDRVLGGGMVAGSVNLIGGAPGMGKSTLLLQVGGLLAANKKKVLYVSGEESLRQIKLRADRLGIHQADYFFLIDTNIGNVIHYMAEEKPDLLVIDSIQTMYSDELESLPGNVSQVRYCGHLVTTAAKDHHIPVFMVGHVTKEGNLAGPRVLEHMVDCLLLFEGDDQHIYRLLRSVKNRFGSTNEVGIFEMTERGIQEVRNPSAYLLSQRQKDVSGSVVTVNMEGSRPLMIEVQALVTPASYNIPQRTSTGFDHRRLSLLLAVLEKRLGMKFAMQDVFVNIAGGVTLREPAADLAVAAALVSSLRDQAVSGSTAVMGEIGLAGEIRGIQQMEKRFSEARRLGFNHLVTPPAQLNHMKVETGFKHTPVHTIREAMEKIFA